MARRRHPKGHINVNELGKVDNTTFLVIIGGALLVVILIMVFLGKMPFISSGEKSEEVSEISQTENTAQAESTAVTIENFAFFPQVLTVKVGTTVTFTNNDSIGHSGTSDDGATFDTGILEQGQSGTVTFNTAGTFSYHCTPHPNMTGTVIVEE